MSEYISEIVEGWEKLLKGGTDNSPSTVPLQLNIHNFQMMVAVLNFLGITGRSFA